MAIKTITVRIEGKSALLMHKFPLTAIEAMGKKSPEEQAELVAYRDPDSQGLYVPGVCVQRSLINAAVFSKGKGRASLQKVVAACLMVCPERIFLGTKEFKVDSRPVVVPATRGRIVRHRPRLDKWECEFELDYDDTLLKEEQVRKVVDDAGDRVGLLDFRPERKGPYGRFMVTRWNNKDGK